MISFFYLFNPKGEKTRKRFGECAEENNVRRRRCKGIVSRLFGQPEREGQRKKMQKNKSARIIDSRRDMQELRATDNKKKHPRTESGFSCRERVLGLSVWGARRWPKKGLRGGTHEVRFDGANQILTRPSIFSSTFLPQTLSHDSSWTAACMKVDLQRKSSSLAIFSKKRLPENSDSSIKVFFGDDCPSIAQFNDVSCKFFRVISF